MKKFISDSNIKFNKGNIFQSPDKKANNTKRLTTENISSFKPKSTILINLDFSKFNHSKMGNKVIQNVTSHLEKCDQRLNDNSNLNNDNSSMVGSLNSQIDDDESYENHDYKANNHSLKSPTNKNDSKRNSLNSPLKPQSNSNLNIKTSSSKLVKSTENMLYGSIYSENASNENDQTLSNIDSGYMATAISSCISSSNSSSAGGSNEFISASTNSSCEFISANKMNAQKDDSKKVSPKNNKNGESKNNASANPQHSVLNNDDTYLSSSDMSISCDELSILESPSSLKTPPPRESKLFEKSTNQGKSKKNSNASNKVETNAYLNSISTKLLNNSNEELSTKEKTSKNELIEERDLHESSSDDTSVLPDQKISNTFLGIPIPSLTSSSISFNNNNSKFSSEYTIPPRLEYLLDLPICNHDIQVQHAWNPEDRSLNIFVKESDPLTLHRHPVAQSTDCIRTKVGYTKGIHLWELSWNSRQRGTHAIIGVSTEKTPLHCVGYQSLIGSSAESWGWDLGRNRACHNTKASSQPPPVYPKMLKPDESFVVPDNFMMCLDMDEGTLSFMADGQFLGVAFRGLKGKKLYPIVSAVWGHCEITMRYLNGLDPNPLPLIDLCRRCIRQKVGKHRLDEVNKLNLPNSIKNFLLYKQ
jgi:SPRY domain-containing SOCS box protein 1/4